MTTMFQTIVVDLPPTPLGLLPARWAIEHRCTVCNRKVATDDLIAHAKAHTAGTTEKPPLDRVP